MKFLGEVVKHKFFGVGKIVKFENENITVLFEESKEERKFTYPAVFGAFLESENKGFLKQIEEDKNIISEREAEIKRIKQESEKPIPVMELKKTRSSYLSKTVPKASNITNIALKCNFCDGGSSEETVGYNGACSDSTLKYNINSAKHTWCSQPENMCYKYLHGEVSREELDKSYEAPNADSNKAICYESQMLDIWTVSAGITQTGDKKGKPMSFRNVKANSLALLTTKLPHAEEIDRFIFAVFLIDENHGTDNKDEGYIVANPKYRMQLSLEEAKQLKFWDFYFNPNKPERIILGSGLHRYLTDFQAAQGLMKICEIKEGTPEEELSKEFLEYYCKIKKMEIDSIPKPYGALQRIIKKVKI